MALALTSLSEDYMGVLCFYVLLGLRILRISVHVESSEIQHSQMVRITTLEKVLKFSNILFPGKHSHLAPYFHIRAATHLS